MSDLMGPWGDWDSPLYDAPLYIDASRHVTPQEVAAEAWSWWHETESGDDMAPGDMVALTAERMTVDLCDEHEGGCREGEPCLTAHDVWRCTFYVEWGTDLRREGGRA